MTGTGTTPVSQASTLAFNSQAVGVTSVAKTVPITNNQAVPLAISNIALTGHFAQTNNCPASLPALATCTVTLTFTPTKTGPSNRRPDGDAQCDHHPAGYEPSVEPVRRQAWCP